MDSGVASTGVEVAQLRAKGWSNPSHDLHLPPGYADDLRSRCIALQLVLPPDAVWSQLTAALLREWWLPATVRDTPLVACSDENAPHPNRRGVYIRRCAVSAAQRETLHGARVACTVRTTIELAEVLALIDLVVVIDCALHRDDCTLVDLLAGVIPRHRCVRKSDLRREKGLSRISWERYGYVASEICQTPALILRDAEVATGLPHDPRRIDRWLTGYKASSLAPTDAE